MTAKVTKACGAEAAVRALSRGEPFTGLAARELCEVIQTFEDEGRLEIMKHNAYRGQATANLFWQAIQKAADEGDLQRLDEYVKRFGWLLGVVTRLWQAEAIEEKAAKGNSTEVDAILAEYRDADTAEGTGEDAPNN